MKHSVLIRYIGSTLTSLVIFCLFSASNAYAKTIYVDSGATDANNGISWNDAYVDFQAAIDSTDPGDEIWVASGTYRPISWPNGGFHDREKHFSLKNGVTVYGGFAGTETSRNERNVGINNTILSGDIGIEGDVSDNCYNVFYHPEGANLDSSAVLDGFTITGGNADGQYYNDIGGGMYNYSSSPTITNCIFRGNSASYASSDFEGNTYYRGSGGGMYNYSSFPMLTNCTFSGNWAGDYGGGMYNHSSSPTLNNCIFSDNLAGECGGGMYNHSSSPILTNCMFSGNSVSSYAYIGYVSLYWGFGGGMGNDSSSPTLINCTLSGNRAADYGGGVYNASSSPSLINCTFSSNSSEEGGGILNSSSSPTLTSCILWGNDAETSGNEIRNYQSSPIVSFCDIKGSFVDGVWDEEVGTDGGNNISSDPLFVRNPGTNGEDDQGDLHLTADSPCIDAGDPSISGDQDIDGEARVFDGDQDGTAIVDIGADEYVDSDYDGIPDREDAFPNDPDNTDDGNGGTGGSSSGGSSGGCFINSLFGVGEQGD